jgi:hypothetical protein
MNVAEVMSWQRRICARNPDGRAAAERMRGRLTMMTPADGT